MKRVCLIRYLISNLCSFAVQFNKITKNFNLLMEEIIGRVSGMVENLNQLKLKLLKIIPRLWIGLLDKLKLKANSIVLRSLADLAIT